jgi:hypothetical protein
MRSSMPSTVHTVLCAYTCHVPELMRDCADVHNEYVELLHNLLL